MAENRLQNNRQSLKEKKKLTIKTVKLLAWEKTWYQITWLAVDLFRSIVRNVFEQEYIEMFDEEIITFLLHFYFSIFNFLSSLNTNYRFDIWEILYFDVKLFNASIYLRDLTFLLDFTSNYYIDLIFYYTWFICLKFICLNVFLICLINHSSNI